MSVEMVHVCRGDYIESIHRGDLAVVHYKGHMVYEAGNGRKETYWRSAAKPFQLLPLIEAGGVEAYRLNEAEIALMTSSHNGEEKHIKTLQCIFEKGGINEAVLKCGAAMPTDQETAEDMIKKGIPCSSKYNGCSGNHSGMILACKLKGYDFDGYLEFSHPIQQEILQTISEISAVPKENIKIGIDGCGIPAFRMPLYNMALAYATLAEPRLVKSENRQKALKIIANAMTGEPFLVAGTKRLDTLLMEVTKGRVLAKFGAESVYCISVMDRGIGIALKIEDGAHRGIDPVIIEILKRLDCLNKEELETLRERHEIQIKNNLGQAVGCIKASL